ncbi:MAG: hypothetical protein HY077_12100 [Elusimicrobia bacterium]|nr:hypothetical protein [Elusimicrobiota bacterium]
MALLRPAKVLASFLWAFCACVPVWAGNEEAPKEIKISLPAAGIGTTPPAPLAIDAFKTPEIKVGVAAEPPALPTTMVPARPETGVPVSERPSAIVQAGLQEAKTPGASAQGPAPAAESVTEPGRLQFDKAAAAKPSAQADPMDWIGRVAGMPGDMAARAKTNPAIVKTLVVESLKGLKGSKSVNATGDVAKIMAEQIRFKAQLAAAASRIAKEKRLSADQIITHGTNLKGLLGMIFTGEIEATTRYKGVSGESAEVWGGYGLEVGAGYGATKGTTKGQPGVVILMLSPTLKVVRGDALNRSPKVSEDFLAAVITDGERTVVLDKAALEALAGSAKTWKDNAVRAAHGGSMREFYEWEAVKKLLTPD